MAKKLNHLPNREGCLMDARRNRVIVCEDLNFIWEQSELREIKRMWKMNFSVKYMAEYFDRDPDEILIALIHLAKDDRIQSRIYGLKGLKWQKINPQQLKQQHNKYAGCKHVVVELIIGGVFMELLTIPKIAELINVPESNLRYYQKKFKKYIPEVSEGKHKRFKYEAVEIFSFITDSYKTGTSSEQIEKELQKRYAITIEPENDPQQEIKTQHIETTKQQLEIFQDMVMDSLREIVHEEIMNVKNEIASTLENKFDEFITISRKEKHTRKGFFKSLFK